MNKLKFAWGLIPFLIIGCNDGNIINDSNTTENQKIALGKSLYNDTALSKSRTMACATCHGQNRAFIDKRESTIGHMAAASSDGEFFGARNVPTNSYAAFIPDFGTIVEDGETLYVGGNFLDGRAKDLKAQAKGPFLDPVEMQMGTAANVVTRVKENDSYVEAFIKVYGESVFDDVNTSYDAIADAIATFEKTDLFSPFDSKYDRSLNGTYTLTAEEQKGLVLFSDEKKGNCIACHPITKEDGSAGLFTDYTYDNLGVPVNAALLVANGKPADTIDNGLFNNSQVTDPALKGAFRVSSLRNIAVTGPYMHNGVFKELKTVVSFYNTRDVAGAINPETGNTWLPAEVPATVNHEELGDLKFTEEEENALVAFLETLTDKKYEK